MRKSLVSLLLLMIMVIGTGALAMSVSGCSKAESEEKLTPADFTVVCYDDIPKDFLREIEEKKETDFKLTCISDGNRIPEAIQLPSRRCRYRTMRCTLIQSLSDRSRERRQISLPHILMWLSKLRMRDVVWCSDKLSE